MQVQVNIAQAQSSAALESHVHAEAERNIGRFATRVTRVEVHLNDHNGSKHAPNDKRCLIEARPAGHDPLVVEHLTDDYFTAVTGGMEKIERVLRKHFDKRNEHHPH
jgi:ribosomal subunit interface protein